MEGLKQYGHWFVHAAGSGIWLNLGRTLVVHTKSAELRRAGLWARAQAQAQAPERSRRAIRRGTASRRQSSRGGRSSLATLCAVSPGECYLVRSEARGFDSVQLQFNGVMGPRRAFAEVVVFRRGPNATVELQDGCAPGIELRWGSRAALQPCVCAESPVLNCAGTG